MKITVICEGKTEKVFREHLKRFVDDRLGDKPKPRLDFFKSDGAIPSKDKLRRTVRTLLDTGSQAVIALTDVYPGFRDASDAKVKMAEWVGPEERFFPHVALHDFEAWLLPYWEQIQKLAGKDAKPWGEPETVNHNSPPAHRLKKLFEAGNCRDSYSKTRDAGRILREANLMISINACPELRAFVNSILRLCGGKEID
jgi:hypothetical protein